MDAIGRAVLSHPNQSRPFKQGGIIDAQRNGGVVEVKERPAFGQAQLDAIARMESARDNYDRLQVGPSATKEEINKAYKKMVRLG